MLQSTSIDQTWRTSAHCTSCVVLATILTYLYQHHTCYQYPFSGRFFNFRLLSGKWHVRGTIFYFQLARFIDMLNMHSSPYSCRHYQRSFDIGIHYLLIRGDYNIFEFQIYETAHGVIRTLPTLVVIKGHTSNIW